MAFIDPQRHFGETAGMEYLDNRDEIQFRIDHFFELGDEFDLIGGGDVAPKDTFLVVFEVFFAEFEDPHRPIFPHLTKLIGDVVKQKNVVVMGRIALHIFSLSEKGTKGLFSMMVLISLYPSSLRQCL